MTEETFSKAQNLQSDIIGINNLLDRMTDNHFSCDGLHGEFASKLTKKLKKDLKKRLKELESDFNKL